MPQYDGNNHLSIAELAKSPFLAKRVNEKSFKNISNKGLNINVKKNQTIWAIFNEENEKKLVNIRGRRDLPISEDTYVISNKRRKTWINIPRINRNNLDNYQRLASSNQIPYGTNSMGSSFYG